MKIFVTCFVFLALIVFFVTPSSAGDDVVVMSIKGKAEYQKAGKGKFIPLTVGLALKSNDIVKTSFASYTKLMYKQRQLLSIDENTTIKISSLTARLEGNSSDKNSTTGKIMSYLADKMSKSQSKDDKQNIYGAVRGTDEVFNAVFPRKGYVQTTLPTFEWVNAGEKSAYTFTLLDENLTPIFEQTVDGTRLMYSESNPKLQYGKKYVWRVIRKSDSAESDFVSFTILLQDTTAFINRELSSLKDELKKMKADEIIFHVITGTYFEQRELFYDAFVEYKEAVHLAPDVKEYREMANLLLLRMGLYNEQEILLR